MSEVSGGIQRRVEVDDVKAGFPVLLVRTWPVYLEDGGHSRSNSYIPSGRRDGRGPNVRGGLLDVDRDIGIKCTAVKRRLNALLFANFLHHSAPSCVPAIGRKLTMQATPQLRSRVLQSALPGAASWSLMGRSCHVWRWITIITVYLLSAFEIVSWDIKRRRLTS
jgi:hypothetical protein